MIKAIKEFFGYYEEGINFYEEEVSLSEYEYEIQIKDGRIFSYKTKDIIETDYYSKESYDRVRWATRIEALTPVGFLRINGTTYISLSDVIIINLVNTNSTLTKIKSAYWGRKK